MIVQCNICPKRCVIPPGASGECRIRANVDGRLLALTYGHPCALNVDPIEKKPLFHFLPGTSILSLATAGCNLRCRNCQNWEISQGNPEEISAHEVQPEAVVNMARRMGCDSAACTYTDPVAYFEYALHVGLFARDAGLRHVLVSAAYVNPRPWGELCRAADAVTIDIKAYSDSFYREVCGGTLQPVLDAVVQARQKGVHVELSNLVIPTLNDRDQDFQALARWVAENVGRDTPFHFLRFHPRYRMTNLPPTPDDTLIRARDIARAAGLQFVYMGNTLVPDAENTICPGCGAVLIRRSGQTVRQNRLVKGACPDCNRSIYGVWR